MNRPPQNGDAAADLRLHHEELPLLPGPTRHQVAELPPALPLLQRLFRQGGQTRLVVVEIYKYIYIFLIRWNKGSSGFIFFKGLEGVQPN